MELSQVHVFGAPQSDALQPDERLCQDADAKASPAVFHPAATRTAEGWTCVWCWYATQSEGVEQKP